MQTSWRTELPQLLLVVAMFIAGAWAWSHVPEKIPVHWNFQGEADRYGGRLEGLFLTPAIAVGIYLLLLVVPRIDPRIANHREFAGPFAVIRFTVIGFLAVVHAILILAAMGRPVHIGTVIPALVGILLIVLGVVMSRIPPNWFAGVRTPWTLSSDLSWQKTHRLAGWLFPLSGLALILTGFLRSQWVFYAMLAFLLASVVGLVVYSYVIWRQDPAKASRQR